MKPTDLLNIWNALSRRWLNLLGVLTVAALYCAALYLQYVLRQDPCPLCMLQRLIFIAIGLLFFVAGLHHAKAFGAKVYAVLIALFSLGGVAAASRHIWLQNLPKDQVPACGPGLDYMLQNFPLAEVWQELLHGSGECAEKGWTFLALGIPEWSLVWYVLLGVFAVLVGWKKN